MQSTVKLSKTGRKKFVRCKEKEKPSSEQQHSFKLTAAQKLEGQKWHAADIRVRIGKVGKALTGLDRLVYKVSIALRIIEGHLTLIESYLNSKERSKPCKR